MNRLLFELASRSWTVTISADKAVLLSRYSTACDSHARHRFRFRFASDCTGHSRRLIDSSFGVQFSGFERPAY
jgi:hypothetical protein